MAFLNSPKRKRRTGSKGGKRENCVGKRKYGCHPRELRPERLPERKRLTMTVRASTGVKVPAQTPKDEAAGRMSRKGAREKERVVSPLRN